ncbi:hypothetical protein NL676_000143 [Syzygium grande]|nr:hypothetical protein NL676_000143 [Syzygium grande]
MMGRSLSVQLPWEAIEVTYWFCSDRASVSSNRAILFSYMNSLSETSATDSYSKPLGIQFVEYIKRSPLSFGTHQSIVFIVTFLAYTCYLANRKTTVVVKSTLDPASSEVGLKFQPWRRGYFLSPPEVTNVSGLLGSDSGWAPFNGSDGTELLGDLDVAFLSVYAVGMYCSGQLGDRTNLTIFLTVGMIGTGSFTSLFGVGYWANIHNFYYFLLVQTVAGVFQSTGQPPVVSAVAIDGKSLSSETAGDLSTLSDVGGVIGGILAGYISDRLDARAITAASFVYCAIPALFPYRSYGSVSLSVNITLMFITGIFVNGPFALITTAISADLGAHSSLKGNSRALVTVTAITNGTGSIGAAIGPLLTGYISTTSWGGTVFTMLMGLLLTRLIVAEVAEKIEESRARRSSASRSRSRSCKRPNSYLTFGVGNKKGSPVEMTNWCNFFSGPFSKQKGLHHLVGTGFDCLVEE